MQFRNKWKKTISRLLFGFRLHLAKSKWDKVFKNGLNLRKTAFKKFEGIWSAKAYHLPSIFLKAVFHKYYFVHSWILYPNCISMFLRSLHNRFSYIVNEWSGSPRFSIDNRNKILNIVEIFLLIFSSSSCQWSRQYIMINYPC